VTKALQPDDLIAHYHVLRALGAGGMGEVYLARDSTLDRNVALKVLPQMAQDDDRVKRFVLEAKSASSLSHPHIITVYEIGCEPVISGGVARPDKVHYIAMELVDGDSLADIIHDNKADLKSLLGYLAQAADGLSKAHASGIVHRDLKPGNIMVSKDGYAKVLDFGLAKLVEKEAAPDATINVATKQALTMEGMIAGAQYSRIGVHAGRRPAVVLHVRQGQPAVQLALRSAIARRRRADSSSDGCGHGADVLTGRKIHRIRARRAE